MRLKAHMTTTLLSLPTFANLREHVHHTLCSCDGLDPGQIPMQEALLMRKPCGMTFYVKGPRLPPARLVWTAPPANGWLLAWSQGLQSKITHQSLGWPGA